MSLCTMPYLLRSVYQQPCLQTLTISFVERSTFSMQLSVLVDTVQAASVEQS